MRNNRVNLQEIARRLGRLNEEIEGALLQECGNYVGFALGRRTQMPHSFLPMFLINGARVSIGIGKIVVEFFSAAISTNVCKYRS